MYLGHIVELAEKEELFEDPKHPYTRSLLRRSRSPIPEKPAPGRSSRATYPIPSTPSGCRFRTRCPELIAPEGTNSTTSRGLPCGSSCGRSSDARSTSITVRTSRAKFFEGVSLSSDVRALVDEAVDDIADGEWDRAAELLPNPSPSRRSARKNSRPTNSTRKSAGPASLAVTSTAKRRPPATRYSNSPAARSSENAG